MKYAVLATMLLLLISSEAHAIGSGNDLLEACDAFERNATISADGSFSLPRSDGLPWICVGYMNALQQLSNALLLNGEHMLGICPPPESRLTQLIRVFTTYARAHPEELHLSAAQIAMGSLQKTFPCQ
jgi:hypothetical protein